MADSKLERMRALMREEEDRKKNPGRSTSSGGDNASYPFWDIPENSTATLRFLPDADDSNDWFWVERQTIRLTFNGVDGGDFPTNKPVTVTVPCVNMFEKRTCPIIQHINPWWNDPAKKPLAQKYYKKSSFITQGFVVSSPFQETDPPANPIRRFILGNALLTKVKAGLADPDMENNPTDYLGGCDFRVRKTIKGGFNNYDTSEWARRSRPLTEAERIAIEQYGLSDLKQFRGSRPDADGIAMIKAMFEDSLAERPFDYAAYGHLYRPFGSREEGSDVVDLKAPLSSDKGDMVEFAEGLRTERAASEPKPEVNNRDIVAKLKERIGNRAA